MVSRNNNNTKIFNENDAEHWKVKNDFNGWKIYFMTLLKISFVSSLLTFGFVFICNLQLSYDANIYDVQFEIIVINSTKCSFLNKFLF